MDKKENYKQKIDKLRASIDNIDDQIIELINKRGEIAQEIGNIKIAYNLDISQPEREDEIINRILNKSAIYGPKSIKAIWREIIGASKTVQGKIIKVGYLGPIGTFSHQAAMEMFSQAGTEFIPYRTLQELFNDIEKKIINYGVFPIENSLQGTILETIDLLIEKEIFIYSEIELRIIQNLIAVKGTQISQIKHIFSHPQAFAQTRLWINKNLPNVNLIDASSTAEAVKKVKDASENSYAAIGTEFASEIYNLEIIKSKIEDEPLNYTRFLVLSKKENATKTDRMKTSIVFATKHVPGALYKVLKVFSDAEINLTKIESRPSRKGRWDYIFFVDFEGEKDQDHIKRALNEMKSNVLWHKILGSYPMK